MLLVVPSFIFVGLEGVISFKDRANVVAKVGSYKVTQEELDSVQKDHLTRLRQRVGGDATLTAQEKEEILDSLIVQYSLLAEVRNRKLVVPDSVIQKNILSIPGLVSATGEFDKARYQQVLASQGLTAEGYQASLRQDLALQQLNSAVATTAFVPRALSARLAATATEERQVQMSLIKSSDFVDRVKITDQMVNAYYKNNVAKYTMPETIKVNYVVLDSKGVESQLSVTDAEIEAYYSANMKKYGVEEERRANHILIGVKAGASSAQESAAKAKAENILAQVRKDPKKFAALAKQNSDDSASATQGGDLGFFTKGRMVKPFEDAVYQLKKGETSNLVRTEFGFHIIQLTEIKPGSVKPLNVVKEEIVAELKQQLVNKKYTELAETFSNMVYEQADSLLPVAEKLKLKVETIDNVTRQNLAELNPLLNNPKLLQGLFSDDVLKNKHNTEAVEVAKNTLVSARVVEYKPGTVKPLSEVISSVRAALTQEEALRLARLEGEAKLQALKTNSDAISFGESKNVTRRDVEKSREATLAIMNAVITKLPTFVGVSDSDGFTVYRINKIERIAPSEEVKRIVAHELGLAFAQQDVGAYIDLIKRREKVKILKPVKKEGAVTTPS
jgi:peptidyl-prolyl cis-trans isomerase D